MSQFEVFRPSNGPLMVRGSLAEGVAPSMDVFRKDAGSPGARPPTRSSSRFGHLSHNAFFARHNPHPNKVKHIKGLLDVPICAVNDSGYFASPRYSLNFPPNSHNQAKLKNFDAALNAINSGSASQRLPLDTITGLQYFTGKNFQFMRDRSHPNDAKIAMPEAWEDELKALTKAATLQGVGDVPRTPGPAAGEAGERPRTSQYSATTGRLLPPPSRAMSRGNSRASRRDQAFSRFQEVAEDPDSEFKVLQLVCQFLQTDDMNSAKSWLVSAPGREKALMLYMVRAALAASTGEDPSQHRHPQPEYIEPGTTLPAIQPNAGDNGEDMLKKIDRLTLDNVSPRPGSVMRGEETKYMRHAYTPAPGEDATNVPVGVDVFRPNKSSHGNRPGSQADRPATGLVQPANPAKPCTPEPKLRYTTTPLPDQKGSLLNDDQAMWQPDMSTGN